MDFLSGMAGIGDDPVLKNAYDAYSEGSYMSSFSIFEEAGTPEAKYCMAFQILNGQGVQRNPKKAFSLFKESMDGSFLPAISEVAQCYGYGIGVKTDDSKAFELFSKAAELGDPYGMSMLSMMYRNGDGVRRNNKLADEWSEHCDSSGDPGELEDAGMEFLENGHVILGRMFLMRSAVMGAPVSAKALACIYGFGAGVHADDDEASDWEDTADANGWDDVTREDLEGHEKWFSRFIDLDEMDAEPEYD